MLRDGSCRRTASTSTRLALGSIPVTRLCRHVGNTHVTMVFFAELVLQAKLTPNHRLRRPRLRWWCTVLVLPMRSQDFFIDLSKRIAASWRSILSARQQAYFGALVQIGPVNEEPCRRHVGETAHRRRFAHHSDRLVS
ncbi:unnamed protein product [Symbiodinium natans]|uniref:Uncharacterized protein n=1 Tax=Symbiodinium natans TaxID=878477 RepID=A0A812VBS3_9DINO|nr:unnamed protein product [Symbiodinium natans]